MYRIMKDELKWVDEEYREEKKLLRVPSPEQNALAALLEDCGGGYHAFATWTFRPNQYEEIVQKEGGEYYQNKKLSWSEGDKIVKRSKRGYQGEWSSGGVVRGTPGISPGWSPHSAFGAVSRAIMKDTHGLAKSRWFMCIEGSKYRNCAHGHSLHANASTVNWEGIKERWESKYGWFKFEVVKGDQAMADYLCKKYVGKDYGNEDFRFAFSRNSRRPEPDPVPKIYYNMRELIYENEIKGKEKSKSCLSKMDYKKQLGVWLSSQERAPSVSA
jgi:hypothetical protein